MKQAPLAMIVFGLFFTARFSRARYLLVDIDDGAIGARDPVSRDGDGILDSFLNIYKLNVLYLRQIVHFLFETFLCRYSRFDLTDCISDDGYDEFDYRHVGVGRPSALNAAKKSCSRNKNRGVAQTTNTVFFDEQDWQKTTTSLRCQAVYTHVFQCKVPKVDKTPCKSLTEKTMGTLGYECQSCKAKHPGATGFMVEVGKFNGHFYHEEGIFKSQGGKWIEIGAC